MHTKILFLHVISLLSNVCQSSLTFQYLFNILISDKHCILFKNCECSDYDTLNYTYQDRFVSLSSFIWWDIKHWTYNTWMYLQSIIKRIYQYINWTVILYISLPFNNKFKLFLIYYIVKKIFLSQKVYHDHIYTVTTTPKWY